MSLEVTYRSNVNTSAPDGYTWSDMAGYSSFGNYVEIVDIFSEWVDTVHSHWGDNYSFKEWNTARDGSGTTYNAGDKVYESITLYPIWNGETLSPTTMEIAKGTTRYYFNVLTAAERTKISNAITQSSVREYYAKDFSEWPEWVSGNSYEVGDCVKTTHTIISTVTKGWVCLVANSSAEFDTDEWEIVSKFPTQGEKDVLYVEKLTNTSYYWNGTEYVSVGGEYAVFTGATSSAAGTHGLVPAPSAGDEGKFLKGDGTWGEVNTSSSTVRKVSFTIATTDWTQSSNTYVADVTDSHITSTTEELIMYTNSVKNLTSDIDTNKDGTNNKITFIVDSVPTGAISGSIYIISQGNIVADTKVNIDQGVENAGKFLVVNSQGNVEPVTMQAWQGGSY